MPIFRSIAKVKRQEKKIAEQRTIDLDAESCSTSEVQTVSLSKVQKQRPLDGTHLDAMRRLIQTERFRPESIPIRQD